MKIICILSFMTMTILANAQSNLKYGMYSIIPGVGQIANPNQPIHKGWLFMGSTLGLLGGALYFDSQRSKNIRLANESLNVNVKRLHNDRANKWETTRNIVGIAGIGVWVWNIVDAAAFSSGYTSSNSNKRMRFYARSSAGYDELVFAINLNRTNK